MKNKLTQEERIERLEHLTEELYYRTSHLSQRFVHLQIKQLKITGYEAKEVDTSTEDTAT